MGKHQRYCVHELNTRTVYGTPLYVLCRYSQKVTLHIKPKHVAVAALFNK
jgi:hypothetical protein